MISNILVFSTDITYCGRIKRFEWILNQHPEIITWNMDLQDVDKILRIEATENLHAEEVIDIMKTFGCTCEVLPD
ncbi:MAG: hypothetical protein ABJF11_11995 [Reichenbachiella sp.]|uniref:hypothetical protein n=1 Tax=Reichenbachiella sp. TaxID=2184521 RepID=UPI003263347F